MSTVKAIPWKYELKGYRLDLTHLSKSNFYPCMLGGGATGEVTNRDATAMFGQCEIVSHGGESSSDYNQNMLKFLFTGCGWSDIPHTTIIDRYVCYSYGEKTIGCIGRCTDDYDLSVGAYCVWLRGGIVYDMVTNFVPTVFEQSYNSGLSEGSIFAVGPNLSGGTNTRVAITWTPDSAVEKYPVGSVYRSTTLDTAAKVSSALGGTWTLVTTDYDRKIREIHDIALGIDTQRSGNGTVSKTPVTGSYNYKLLESDKNEAVPDGYHREYNLSAEITTGGGNQITLYINNIATNSTQTWSQETFHTVVSTGWFKKSDIVLAATYQYSHLGCNLYYQVTGDSSSWRFWKPQLVVADALDDPIYVWKRTA